MNDDDDDDDDPGLDIIGNNLYKTWYGLFILQFIYRWAVDFKRVQIKWAVDCSHSTSLRDSLY